jgi:NAD+-dependent protein deacetylase SIR2
LNNNTVKPVKAHYFIKKLEELEMLLYNYTQNIDGLELEAGLPIGKLVQAHGHMRTCRCIECKQEHSIEEFYQYVKDNKVMYCNTCTSTSTSSAAADTTVTTSSNTSTNLVKPDIIFFGESLPFDFFLKAGKIQRSDLVIIMGSSLKVYPFAQLVHSLSEDIPIVLINRENPGIVRNNFLFLSGDIEDNIAALCKDLEWTLGGIEDNESKVV